MNNKSNNSNEINLFFVMDLLWNKKIILIIFALLAVVLGIVFYYSNEKQYEISVEIKKNSQAEMSFLSKYNTFVLDISKDTIIAEKIKDEVSVDAKKLLAIFIEKFQKKDGLVESFNSIDSLNNNLNDDINHSNALSFASDFQIVKARKLDYVGIQFITPQIDEYMIVLQEAIMIINKKIHLDLLSSLEETVKSVNVIKDNKIANLESILQARQQQVIRDNERALSILLEQLEIAKKLDITDNELNSIYNEIGETNKLENENTDQDIEVYPSQEVGNNEVTNFIFDLPFDYLQGTVALQSTIDNFRKRDFSSKRLGYIDDTYSKILHEISILEYEQEYLNQLKLIDILPDEEGFQSVYVNLDSAEIKQVDSLRNTLIISFAIGLMIGILFILFREFYRQYKITE